MKNVLNHRFQNFRISGSHLGFQKYFLDIEWSAVISKFIVQVAMAIVVMLDNSSYWHTIT